MDTSFYKQTFRVSSNRLPHWDYASNGYYFTTICTKGRKHSLGTVVCEQVLLSDLGQAVEQCWREIPKHFPCVQLDEHIVMPNHLHGIICITDGFNYPVETQNFASLHKMWDSRTRTLGSILKGFKIGVKKWAREHDIEFAWQARYFDHIIRSEKALSAIRCYIQQNPLKWDVEQNSIENIDQDFLQ